MRILRLEVWIYISISGQKLSFDILGPILVSRYFSCYCFLVIHRVIAIFQKTLKRTSRTVGIFCCDCETQALDQSTWTGVSLSDDGPWWVNLDRLWSSSGAYALRLEGISDPPSEVGSESVAFLVMCASEFATVFLAGNPSRTCMLFSDVSKSMCCPARILFLGY